jgi:hypothetical protein
MKVPYAKKWQKETDKLRQIALDCDLTEELKWGNRVSPFGRKTCDRDRAQGVVRVLILQERTAQGPNTFSKGLESIPRPGDGSNSPRFGRLRPYDRPWRTTSTKPSIWRSPGRR